MWWGLLAFLVGGSLWSFTEYAMHNWVGHNKRSQREFKREHTRHHSVPFYFTPVAAKARMASPKVLLLAGVSVLTGFAIGGWVGAGVGLALAVGFGVAYIFYELTHWALHTFPPRTSVGSFLRKHHFYHHYHEPSANHGVTSPVWDLVFGTLRPAGVVRVPEGFAQPWMVDPLCGEIRPEFAADYVLKRRRAVS